MFDNLNLYIFGDLHDYIISTLNTNLNGEIRTSSLFDIPYLPSAALTNLKLLITWQAFFKIHVIR